MVLISHLESKSPVHKMVNELIVKQMPPDRAERMCDSKLLIEINVVIGPTKVHLIDGFHLWRTEKSRQLIQWFYICYRAGPYYKPCPNLSPHIHGGQPRAEQHNEAKRFHLGMSCWDLHKHNPCPAYPAFLLEPSNPPRLLFCAETA